MARKIEQQITNAIRSRRNFIGGNTAVRVIQNAPHAPDIIVQLHGNTIAKLIAGKLTLDWCGWNTPTTSSRLGCVLDALADDYYACIRKGVGTFMRRMDHSPVATGTLTVQVQS